MQAGGTETKVPGDAEGAEKTEANVPGDAEGAEETKANVPGEDARGAEETKANESERRSEIVEAHKKVLSRLRLQFELAMCMSQCYPTQIYMQVMKAMDDVCAFEFRNDRWFARAVRQAR